MYHLIFYIYFKIAKFVNLMMEWIKLRDIECEHWWDIGNLKTGSFKCVRRFRARFRQF